MSGDVVGGDWLVAAAGASPLGERVLQYFAASTYAGISDAVVGGSAESCSSRCCNRHSGRDGRHGGCCEEAFHGSASVSA